MKKKENTPTTQKKRKQSSYRQKKGFKDLTFFSFINSQLWKNMRRHEQDYSVRFALDHFEIFIVAPLLLLLPFTEGTLTK